jgi:hypothetical protein
VKSPSHAAVLSCLFDMVSILHRLRGTFHFLAIARVPELQTRIGPLAEHLINISLQKP